jgi:hypothetical protein
LLSVFRAVFFQQTLEVAQQDRDSVFSRKVPQITLENQHLAKMLKQLDHNADGNISWEEFTSELSENSEMKTWMSAMDFRIQDLTVLFDILDDGTGVIDFHEFLIAASRIKGQARAVDIAKLLHNQQKIDTKLNMLQMFGPKAINPSAIRHLDSKESKEDKVTKESKELSTNGIASKQHESHSSGKEKAYEDAENSLHARPVPFHQGPHLDSLPREDMVTDAGKDQGALPRRPYMVYPPRKTRPSGVPALNLPNQQPDNLPETLPASPLNPEMALFEEAALQDVDLAEVDLHSIASSLSDPSGTSV